MSSVKVRDFTLLAEPSESVVLVYFEESDGIVHVYRDGTVVLSSPQGSTVTRLPQPGGHVWRMEGFLALLARLGATEQELTHAADIATEREVGHPGPRPGRTGIRRSAMWNGTKSTIALGLAEIVERLTAEEKREFTQLVNWEELQRLRTEARPTPAVRPVGDPRLYIATTADGLSLDLPLEHSAAFIATLPGKLASEAIDIFVQNGEGSQQTACLAADLAGWLERHEDLLREGAIMLEFGPYTVISAGDGCLSLSLEDAPPVLRRQIAQQALALSGFDHEFQADHFSAIVWDDRLEVTE